MIYPNSEVIKTLKDEGCADFKFRDDGFSWKSPTKKIYINLDRFQRIFTQMYGTKLEPLYEFSIETGDIRKSDFTDDEIEHMLREQEWLGLWRKWDEKYGTSLTRQRSLV